VVQPLTPPSFLVIRTLKKKLFCGFPNQAQETLVHFDCEKSYLEGGVVITLIKIAFLRSKYGCQSHLTHLKSWVSFHDQLRQKPFLTRNPL